MRNYKDKTLAALLALFGGIFGLHRFYLGQNGKGFIMILLSIFTLGVVTSIIGIIDFVAFLSMSQETFDLNTIIRMISCDVPPGTDLTTGAIKRANLQAREIPRIGEIEE